MLLPNVGSPQNKLPISQYTAYILNDVKRWETLTNDYEKIADNPKTAKSLYEKLLKIEPNFGVVKNKFYPELLTKL